MVLTGGPQATAEERWRNRTRIGEAERAAFGARVVRRREEALAEVEQEKGVFVNMHDVAQAERRAIERACVGVGILEMRRKRICTPIFNKKLDGFGEGYNRRLSARAVGRLAAARDGARAAVGAGP